MRALVYVKLNDEAGSAFYVKEMPEVVNVSSNERVSDAAATKGYKGFQLSASKDQVVCTLDGSYAPFSNNGYLGILTRQTSGADGVFATPQKFVCTIRGQLAGRLILFFDRICNEYAETIQVSFTLGDKNYSNLLSNSATYMFIDLASIAPEIVNYDYCDLELTISKWSRPYASAKVTVMSLNFTDIFSGDSLIKFNCSENAQNGQVVVQPGIVTQYAEIEIYDRFGYIRDLYKRNALSKAGTLQIVAYDDEESVEYSLGDYRVSDWEISATGSTVKLLGDDPSVDFDKIYVGNLPLKSRVTHAFLQELFSYIPEYSFSYIDSATENYCQNVFTSNSWLSAGTLDVLLKKVCTAAMIRIYWCNGRFVVMRCY